MCTTSAGATLPRHIPRTIAGVNVDDAMARLEGYASRDELAAETGWPEWIDIWLNYRKIVPVRRGHYVAPGLDERVVRALRVGGRLACVSALAYYENRPVDGPVHVLVTYGSSRLGADSSVIHWTRRPLPGTRVVVSREVAEAQARHCRRAIETGS